MNMCKNLERKDAYIVKKQNKTKQKTNSSSNIIVARCTGSQELDV